MQNSTLDPHPIDPVHDDARPRSPLARARESLLGRRRTGGDGGATSLDDLVTVHRLLGELETATSRLTVSLDRREAMDEVNRRLHRAFSPTVTALLELGHGTGQWSPKLAGGCVLRPSTATEDLPAMLARAIDEPGAVLVADLTSHGLGLAPGSGCGIYVPLRAGGELVGVLAVEHPRVGRYRVADLVVADQLAAEVALVLDSSRRFGRLRAFSADADQARQARDLHDRLGQWLTFISYELEGVIRSQQEPSPELTALYATVQSALEEMRDALRQILTDVGPVRPLVRVAREICERFEERTELDVTFRATHPSARLPMRIETELMRILQEALANCEQHARASSVDVTWDVDGDIAVLTIHDDGVGFDPSRGVRDRAEGLVGMQERADSVGAVLAVHSSPGGGTTVAVRAGAAANKEQ